MHGWTRAEIDWKKILTVSVGEDIPVAEALAVLQVRALNLESGEITVSAVHWDCDRTIKE
jgi:hypothetical protein